MLAHVPEQVGAHPEDDVPDLAADAELAQLFAHDYTSSSW
jgi:hypothetical protein